VQAFQKKHGLEVDGVCGPLTGKKLEEVYWTQAKANPDKAPIKPEPAKAPEQVKASLGMKAGAPVKGDADEKAAAMAKAGSDPKAGAPVKATLGVKMPPKK
jgi:hypothetical protein